MSVVNDVLYRLKRVDNKVMVIHIENDNYLRLKVLSVAQKKVSSAKVKKGGKAKKGKKGGNK